MARYSAEESKEDSSNMIAGMGWVEGWIFLIMQISVIICCSIYCLKNVAKCGSYDTNATVIQPVNRGNNSQQQEAQPNAMQVVNIEENHKND